MSNGADHSWTAENGLRTKGSGAEAAIVRPPRAPTRRAAPSTLMIPYIHVDSLRIGPLTLAPFGILVVVGVIVGIALSRFRAKRVGLPDDDIKALLTVVIVSALLGAHVLDTLLYYPDKVLTDPLSLLRLWENTSSFGGFTGAVLGIFAWKFYTSRILFTIPQVLNFRLPVRRQTPLSILPYADTIMAVLPVAWIFGRAGCAVVHDHPGARASANSWLAVAHGPGTWRDYGFFQLKNGSEPRYDLGTLEMLFAVVLAVAFALTWRRASAKGWYVAATCVLYAPVRFGLDFLRIASADGGDHRYAGLTPAQWGCVALFSFGVCLALYLSLSAQGAALPEGESPADRGRHPAR